ncbi:MAG: TauD/TfdA family dioxygenase [Magnetococcales bacterium]|nr:TauD/TfdA family dioxygenase [Magnetococcales bacterium]
MDSGTPLNDDPYRRWKERKLARYPTATADLLVEISDPFALTTAEKRAILDRCAKANMAIYRIVTPVTSHHQLLPAITAQLGLQDPDHHLGAGSEGLSALTPGGSAYQPFAAYIPYQQGTAIGWHTDGYYNPPDRPVRTLCLHCEQPAGTGGENELLDHEVVYIQLRDQNPDYIRALMADDVMTIPARVEQGSVVRPDRCGPVFSLQADGTLHMRFTNRTRSIRWRSDAATQQAVAALKALLDQPSPYQFRGRLEAGWGLISHNVLHTRAFFQDSPETLSRRLYRARFCDRLPQIGEGWIGE